MGLVIPGLDLERHIHALNQSSSLPRAMQDHLLKIRPGQRLRLQELVQQILQGVAFPGYRCESIDGGSIRIAVLDVLADICSTHEAASSIYSRQLNHYKLVREVRRYLLQNHDEAITIVDLCQRFEISRRTLQYAMGMNPNAYLRAIRLNGVRRCLRDPNSNVTSVQEAAANWGFWHLSQFARDYRGLFGELPSERLKRGSVNAS